MQTLYVKVADMLPGDVIESTNRHGFDVLVLQVSTDPYGRPGALVLGSGGRAVPFSPPGHYKVYRPGHRAPGEADATPRLDNVCPGRHCAGRAYAHQHREGSPRHQFGMLPSPFRWLPSLQHVSG